MRRMRPLTLATLSLRGALNAAVERQSARQGYTRARARGERESAREQREGPSFRLYRTGTWSPRMAARIRAALPLLLLLLLLLLLALAASAELARC